MRARTSPGFCSTIALGIGSRPWLCPSMWRPRPTHPQSRKSRRRTSRRSRRCKRPSEGEMESAIPPHLQVSRSRHRRVPDDYQPPYPSFVARHRPAVGGVVMAYFGIQHSAGAPKGLPAALKSLEAAFASANGSRHWDRAAYVDEAGYNNTVSVAYWDDRAAFDAWFPAARA